MSFLLFSLISSRISLGILFLANFIPRLREFPITTMINDILCSSMGYYPSLVSFLNNQVSRYSTTMTNEIFSLMLLKCKKKMVLFNGRLPKLGFFLAQLCIDTQIKGRKVSFSSSSNAIKKGGDGQWYSSMGDPLSLVSFLFNCV